MEYQVNAEDVWNVALLFTTNLFLSVIFPTLLSFHLLLFRIHSGSRKVLVVPWTFDSPCLRQMSSDRAQISTRILFSDNPFNSTSSAKCRRSHETYPSMAFKNYSLFRDFSVPKYQVSLESKDWFRDDFVPKLGDITHWNRLNRCNCWNLFTSFLRSVAKWLIFEIR